jgi:CheY-like chemotaxis protein
VDILTVDRHSRLTLTKSIKRVIPLSPEDRIIVYQDTYNKNLVLKVHRQERVVDAWVMVRAKERNSQGGTGDGISKGVKNGGRSAHSKERSNTNGADTTNLYSTPILLVDDDRDVVFAFGDLIKSEGYGNVRTFSDSRSALKHISEVKDPRHYRLAVLDVRMPGINGLQLYQILKILNPSIKAVFTTGLDAVEEMASMYPEIGPSDILRKPVDAQKFIETVNSKVGSSIIR